MLGLLLLISLLGRESWAGNAGWSCKITIENKQNSALEKACLTFIQEKDCKVAPFCIWSAAPTEQPTQEPTQPTQVPTREPTLAPTHKPTTSPTEDPSLSPTPYPTSEPTVAPTKQPTEQPSTAPTEEPSHGPSQAPSSTPSEQPSSKPSEQPSEAPTEPTPSPTSEPTPKPSLSPTTDPTEPTGAPSISPTAKPNEQPTNAPTSPKLSNGTWEVEKKDLQKAQAFNQGWPESHFQIIYDEFEGDCNGQTIKCDIWDTVESLRQACTDLDACTAYTVQQRVGELPFKPRCMKTGAYKKKSDPALMCFYQRTGEISLGGRVGDVFGDSNKAYTVEYMREHNNVFVLREYVEKCGEKQCGRGEICWGGTCKKFSEPCYTLNIKCGYSKDEEKLETLDMGSCVQTDNGNVCLKSGTPRLSMTLALALPLVLGIGRMID